MGIVLGQLLGSVRELLAQLARSASAKRRHPHVYFGHNVAVGKNCDFGTNVRIYSGARLSSVKIGSYSYVGGCTHLKNAEIGRFCSIGPDVRVGLGVHPTNHVSTYPGFFSTDASGSSSFGGGAVVDEYFDISIGNDVWIGSNAMICDGVQIGHGAIIGAGAVVTDNVRPYAIVGGVPARLIRNRFDDDMIAFLLQRAWWDESESFLRTHATDFASPATFKEKINR